MLTNYHLAVDNFNGTGKTLMRSTLSGITLLADSDLYRRLRDGFPIPGGLDRSVEYLLAEHFLVPDRRSDIRRALSKLSRKVEQRRMMSVTLMTTGACNMACKYCFQNELLPEKMHFEKEHIDILANWVVERAAAQGVRTLMFHFYGGEPLMNFPVIEAAVKNIRPRLARHKIRWNMSITTNGSLMTREVAGKLAQFGCALAIVSLDGPKEIHDFRRPLKNRGASSFDRVVRGIKNALGRFNVMVRSNVDRQNAGHVEELMDRMDRMGITGHPNFFHSIEVVGPIMHPTAHIGSELLSIRESGQVAKRLLDLQLSRGIKIFGNMPSEVSCEHIMKNTFTVDHLGRVFPCPGFAGFDDFMLGDIREGIDEAAMEGLYSVRPWENKPCIDCPYLPQCHSGCRSCAVISAGGESLEGYRHIYCRKAFFDETFPTFLKNLYHRENTAKGLLPPTMQKRN